MKTTIFTIAALLIAFVSTAQETTVSPAEKSAKLENAEGDTVKVTIGETQLLVINDEIGENGDTLCDSEHDEVNFHWMGVDIGVNGLLNSNNGLTPPTGSEFLEINHGESIYASLNFIEKDVELIDNRVRFVTGMGIDWNSYSFDNNIVLTPNSEVIAGSVDTINVYTKNKLRVTSLTVPAMFGFISDEQSHKSFRLAAGVVGKYVLSTKTKQTYKVDGVTYKPMVKSDFNVNPWALAATVRMGYSWFNMYASYGLTSFFQQNEGPDMRNFTVGVSMLLD